MTEYSVKGADGKIYTIDGPENATDQEIREKIREQLIENRPDESWYEDLAEGVGLSVLETYHGIRDLAGIPAENMNEQLEDWRQDAGQSGWGTAGQVVGEIGQIVAPGGAFLKALTIPNKANRLKKAIEASKKAKYVARGATDTAAATLLAATQAPDIGESRGSNAEQALKGALAGEIITGGAGKVIKGLKKTDAAKRLTDAGAYLTPGQSASNVLINPLESIADVVPVLAPSVRKARARGEKEIAEIPMRLSVAPGKEVTESGVKGVAQLKKGFEEAYEDAWSGASSIDNNARMMFVSVLENAMPRVSKAQKRELKRILEDFGDLTEDINPISFKAMDNILRKRISSAKKDYDYQTLLTELRKTLREGAPSGVFERLKAVDAKYGNYLVTRKAAKNAVAKEGEFTSPELISALKSVGKDSVGEGSGPMQREIMDIARVSKTGDDPAPLETWRRLAGLGFGIPGAQTAGDFVMGNTGLQKTIAAQVNKVPEYLKRPAALGSTYRDEDY